MLEIGMDLIAVEYCWAQ